MELADVYHASLSRNAASWAKYQFDAVADARTGTGKSVVDIGEGKTAQVTAAEILGASLPYVDGFNDQDPAAHPEACETGTILVASRPGGARVAVTRLHAVPGRGVLAVRPGEPGDLWWLLHELRSRSGSSPKQPKAEARVRSPAVPSCAWRLGGPAGTYASSCIA